MRSLITFILFLFISTFVYSKGAQGTYTIVGIAYGPDSVSLKNVELIVKFGKETKTIKTNAQGGFNIEVKWSTVCATKLTEKQQKEETRKMNPEYIYVTYKGKEIKIKNDWERISRSEHHNVQQKHDLMF